MKQADKNKLSRERIMRAAISDFNETNCQDIRINNICQKNNISKGLLYHYFSSKEDLFYSCLTYVTELLAESIMSFPVNADISLAENLHSFYKERIIYWRKNPEDYILTNFAIGKYYSTYDEKALETRNIFINASNKKLKELLGSYKLNLEIPINNLLSVMYMVYMNLFMNAINDIIAVETAGDIKTADEKSAELLKLYDGLINLLLHGIKNDD